VPYWQLFQKKIEENMRRETGVRMVALERPSQHVPVVVIEMGSSPGVSHFLGLAWPYMALHGLTWQCIGSSM